jgi:Mce-associated membrane protein
MSLATDAHVDEQVSNDAGTADDVGPVEANDAKRVLRGWNRPRWSRVAAYGVLPTLALVLTLAAAFLKWQDHSARSAETSSTQSVRAATDSTIAMLSYRPDTVDADLGGAADRLTGDFRDEYTRLVADVVAPGAKQQQITAVATVPAAASVSASERHAVVLLAVNQALTIGGTNPTSTASSVRVTLERIGERWLVSKFEPV